MFSDLPKYPYGPRRATSVCSNPVQGIPPKVIQAVVRQERQIITARKSKEHSKPFGMLEYAAP